MKRRSSRPVRTAACVHHAIWVFAAAVALSNCYSPQIADCSIKCASDGACPSGLHCDQGLCTSSTGGCEDRTAASGGSAGASSLGDSECNESKPCENDLDTCVQADCVEGKCVSGVRREGSPCKGGLCDHQGTCVVNTCGSGVKDGQETGKDCGGPCGPCPDYQGCRVGEDCVSGVCTDYACKPSACTDGVKNGTETDEDCGGSSCSVRCALTQRCVMDSDCAGTTGGAVRCVANACSSTAVPDGSLVWFDFAAGRVIACADASTSGHTCLVASGGAGDYQVHGSDAAGQIVDLDESKMIKAGGAVGEAGYFDGSLRLSRYSDLTLPTRTSFTVMAWVKDERTSGQSTVVLATTRYAMALDSTLKTRRFLASITTDQGAHDFLFNPATDQVPAGQWHHLAEVYDSVDAKMIQYVDGTPVNSTTVGGTLTAGSKVFFIGCDSAWNNTFTGYIDELAVYSNRALTASEIADYVRRSRPAP